MAAYNKCNQFVEDLCSAKHDFNAAGHVYKVMLSNVAMIAANAIKADWTDIAGGNGYTAGGEDSQNTLAEAAGVVTVTCTNITWTAAGGAMAQFRYVGVYNDTQGAPVKPTVCWWDYGSGLTLAVGESFTIKFDNQAVSGALFTLT